MNELGDRLAYWGTCPNFHTMIVLPHPDLGSPLPDQSDWEDAMPSCPVCDRYVNLEDSDPLPMRLS